MLPLVAAPVRHARGILWRYPETWTAACSTLAWAVLLASALVDHRHLLGDSATHTLSETFSHSFVMVIAMMTPVVLVQVRHVAVASLWPRRYLASLTFWLAYVSVWTCAATVLILASDLGSRHFGRDVVLGTAAIVAVHAYISPRRARRLRACTLTRPLRPDGPRADLDCLAYGGALARRCVATCWAPMAVTVVSHGLISMAAISVLQYIERRQYRPTPRQRGSLAAAMVLIALTSMARLR